MAGQTHNIKQILENMKVLGWPIRNGRGAGHLIVTSPAGHPMHISLNVSRGSGYHDSIRQIEASGFFEAWEAHVQQSKPARKRVTAAVRPAPAKVAVAPFSSALPAEALPEDPDGMVTRTIVLTPALATEYLNRPPAQLDDGTQIMQRTLSQIWVEEIATWIRNGDWDESYEGIAFDPTGALLDGAHRCWAVIEADQEVPVRATFNAPARLFQITNQGRKRSNANILQTLSDPSARDLASALRMVWQYGRWTEGDKRFTMTHWRNWTSPPMSGPELVRVRAAHTPPISDVDIHDSLTMVGPMRKIKGVVSAGIAWHHLAAMYWQGDPGLLVATVEKLRAGTMLTGGDPVLAFRDWSIAMGGKRLLDKRERQFMGLLKMWRAVVAGDEMKSVRIGVDEPMPKFPTMAKRRRAKQDESE
jgi:hypothetical protein